MLTLNVANPSAARAERQLARLAERPEHVLVLTETSSGAGSPLLLERLAAAGWEVRSGPLQEREREVAIATRVRVAHRDGDVVAYLSSRAETVSLDRLDVVGLYVPSRDDSSEKVERKHRLVVQVRNRERRSRHGSCRCRQPPSRSDASGRQSAAGTYGRTRTGRPVRAMGVQPLHLGPVGVQLVAETFLGLLRADPLSYLHIKPTWRPTLPGPGRRLHDG